MTHRYRVREIIKDGQDPRYILVDEAGRPRYQSSFVFDGYEAEDRFEKVTFATPEDAWASIKDELSIPAETPFYKYTFYIKNGGVSFDYISRENTTVHIDEQWIGLKTINDEHVHISRVELLRFTVKEV